MGDYISRDMAIARLTKVEVTNRLATMTDAKREIADMPAADVVSRAVYDQVRWERDVAAVPVVRCKDCQNLRQSGTGWWSCEYGGTITPQDYCSRAERITNVLPLTEAPQRVPWEAD